MLVKEKMCIFAIRMMKKQVYIWLTISMLVILFTGCGGVPDYDKRLVKADSLVYEHPGQTKDILLKINPNDLNEGNQAYYNLLFTQTSYLNYDVFTNDNDSMINQALKFYKRHKSDREKYTRSYIYKGVVLDELGQADSAMTYYKWAELDADKDDHFNHGYSQLRMGSLYKRHNAWDGRDIEKYADAVNSFRKVQNNHNYLIICLRDLGSLYRFRQADKAEETLNEAIKLAENEKDTANIIHGSANLAYLFFMQSDIVEKDSVIIVLSKAHKLLQRILSFNRFEELEPFEYTTFADVYANIMKPDSATWFMNLAKKRFGDSPSYYKSEPYLEAMSQIAKVNGNMLEYYKLSHEHDSIERSLMMNQDIIKIMDSERDCSRQYEKEQYNKRLVEFCIMVGLMALLLLLALWFYRRSHRYDKLVLELKDQSKSQLQDLTGLQGSINELKINDERLKGFISSHMNMMRDVIDACYHEPNNRIAENMKRIIKFQDSNRDNWLKLYDYIDLEHNNIMTLTREQYPQLNDKDLMLLALTCMGYSYIQTAIIMGYSNATSVSVIKQRLAKKMGLDCSLNEYIEKNGNMKNQQ